MPVDPIGIPSAVSSGSSILARLGSFLRPANLLVECRAKAEDSKIPNDRHQRINIDVRVFNNGKPITIRKVGLVQRPSVWARLRNSLTTIDLASETWVQFGIGAATTKSGRHLPHHIPSGDFHIIPVTTLSLWPPSALQQARIAVWHSFSKRPTLAEIELPLKIKVFEGDPWNTRSSEIDAM